MTLDRTGRGEDWLFAVWSRRKWPAVVVFLLAAAAGVAAAVSVPDVYQATATVLVEEPRVDASAAGNLDRRLQLITQEAMSRARLETLIQTFGLYPHLRPDATTEGLVQRMRKDIRTEFKAPPVAGGPASTLAFAIRYRAADPEAAAAVANALAAFYLEEDVKIRGRNTSAAVQVLKGQLDEVTRTLEEQRRHGATPSGLGDLSDRTAVDLAAVGRVHADLRSATEERMRALDRRNDLLRRLDEAETGPSAAPEAPGRRARLENELAELRRRFSDKYPDVIRAQAELDALGPAEGSAAPGAAPAAARTGTAARLRESLAEVDAEIARLRAREEGLRTEIAGYAARLDSAPQQQRALDEASRDYRATRDTYDSLRRRYEQAQLDDAAAGAGGGPRFRILDAAVVPTHPAAPNRTMLLGLALLVAVGLAVAVMAGLEYFDTSFHSVDQIAAFTRVPVLASIPHIAGAREARTRRARFGLATLAVAVGLVLVAQAARSFAGAEEGLLATMARGRS